MAYDPDLNLIPDIAESYTISDDGLVYTFKIKEAAVFQDGKPIRAEDFKWSFERACDPATGSRTADTYLGDIVGCRDKLQGQADAVVGVVVVDDLTLELTIDEPKGFFLAKMTYPTAYVLDRENVESSDTWYETPNGSGPYRLAEYVPDEGAIILDRNENFYGEPQPILERVIFLIDAPIDLMTGYQEGLGSIGLSGFFYDTIPVGTSNLSVATDRNNPLSKEFVSTEELSVFYIGFNVNRPPFDDPLVRQALNLALDKERMVKLVFQGAVPAANGIVPPTMPNYQNPDLSEFEFDSERALELIAESTYGDVSELPEITFNLSGTGGAVSALTEAIVESWKTNLGLEVVVEQVAWPEFLQDLDSHPMPYQMYQLGWVADYPDPQNFLEILFHSKSAQNHGEYSNPEVDAVLDKARGIQDLEERFAVYRQAEQLILEDAVWIPLYFSVESALVKPYVQNFQSPPIKVPRFQYMSIAAH
jgi:oligopeptide transport system substrate-binding protein